MSLLSTATIFQCCSRALETHGDTAGIVVGTRRIVFRIEVIAVATIIMPGHDNDALCRHGVGTPEYCVHVGNAGGVRNSWGSRLSECINLYVKASATVFRVFFKLSLDPIARRANSAPRSDCSGILGGKCRACAEAY